MSLNDISQIIKDTAAYGGGALIIVLSLLQVSKIQINPWSWLAKNIGRSINGEVIEKVDKLDGDLQSLKAECDEREINLCRTHILRFGDEILHGTQHSKEHFDQILLDITTYETYCRDHPTFKNNKAAITIDRIKSVYKKCMNDNTFL